MTRPRVVLLQNAPDSGPGRFPDWLAEEGLDPVVLSAPAVLHPSAEPRPSAEALDRGSPRTRMDGVAAAAGGDVAGLVVLGGPMMPDDDERRPFLAEARALVGEALDTGVPVLGICLGAQMLALVAGGAVTADSGELERGSCPITLLPAAVGDELFGAFANGEKLRMIENHRDSITALPPDAVHLGTSDACRVQAFRVGDSAWGVQFHPEAAPGRIAEWNREKIVADGFDRDELIAQAEADAEINATQARALAGAFAAVVRRTTG
jgi:GMP synthase-like glutamine amidotransferase